MSLFLAVSIYSSAQLNKRVEYLVKYPLNITTSLYAIDKAAHEMEIRMGRLMSYNAPSDITLVRDAIERLKKDIAARLQYIIKYYHGPKEEPLRLVASLQKAYTEQTLILARASNLTPEGLSAAIYKKLPSLYADIGNDILSMRTFTDNMPQRVAKESRTILSLNIGLSLFAACLMTGLAFAFQRVLTIRKTLEEQKFQESVLKSISENAGNVFLLYSLRRRAVEYVSPNASSILGVEKEDLESDPNRLLSYCVSEARNDLAPLFESEIARARFSRECLFHNPRTGEERWMLVTLYPVQEQQRVIRYVISISDLTEVKKTQQVLRDALANAQNANKAKSVFLSRMSHEIRTPMNAIIGMTAIATKALDDRGRLEDCLGKISLSSRHLLALINDVLDMSKIESGKFTIADESFNFNELVRNVTSLIYPQAAAKRQEFRVLAEVEHEALRGDPLRLNQILINILSNAIKYTPEEGSIRLHIKEHSSKHAERARMTLTVTDNGIGMSAAFLERLFTPFEQEHGDSSRSKGGTGLGMAITRNIVSMLNGSIRVNSEPGKGSTFVVELEFAVEGEESASRDGLETLKIMIVDDDRETCEYTAATLQRMGVFAEWVLSGAEAVDRTVAAYEQGESYDVVFMDWKMPDMDGIEATRRIRRRVGPDTLIIIISAYDWTEIELEARAAGADAFIAKPMFQSSLYNTLLAVTRPTPDAARRDSEVLELTGKRLLLVEDNDLNREVATEILKETGVAIDVAENGKDAVDMFAASAPHAYAAVIMDVQMPVMDGYQAAKALRGLERPDARTVPIIAMTANAFAEDIAAAAAAGMDGHIGKPIDVPVLFRTLQSLLGTERSRQEA